MGVHPLAGRSQVPMAKHRRGGLRDQQSADKLAAQRDRIQEARKRRKTIKRRAEKLVLNSRKSSIGSGFFDII